MQETKGSPLNVSESLFNLSIYTYGKGGSGREKPIEKQETKPRVPTMCSAKKKKKKTLQNRRKRKFQCSLPRLQSWVRDGVIKRLQVTLSLNLNLILIISSFATSMEYVLKETTS